MAIVSEQSELWGVSNSDAIIRDILDSRLPKGRVGRLQAEAVYAGDMSLLASVASILRQNVTGSAGDVREPDYRPILEFGLSLVQKKGLSLSLDSRSSALRHLRNRLESVVDHLDHLLGPDRDPARNCDLIKRVEYGRFLLAGLDPGKFDDAKPQAYVQFALEDFSVLGGRCDTCDYLADVFDMLDAAERELADDPMAPVILDDAEDRSRWSEVLDAVTRDWGTN